MQLSPSPRTSERSPRETVFFLSGEQTTLPEAEARSLVLAYDPEARVEMSEARVLLARTRANLDVIASRIAFTRRLGDLIASGKLDGEQRRLLGSGTYRVAVFDLRGPRDEAEVIDSLARQVGAKVSLRDPDREVTIVRGRRDYVFLSSPRVMRQDWAGRRPRSRAFFHPAAIFPKLSRALVNLSGITEGGVFLDPFCGTGSLLLEAEEVGARVVGVDIEPRMTRGALRNMRKARQDWLAVVRADSKRIPLARADAIATDVPYGRASSTAGSRTAEIIGSLLETSALLIAPGKRLVVMHPRLVPVPAGDHFSVEEEHHLYIHRKLTRTISVLRRV